MSREILTVATAQLRNEQLNNTGSPQHPLVDYFELQKSLDLDILNYNAYNQHFVGEVIRSLETFLRSDVYLAWLSILQKRHYSVIFTMSERAGIPFAAMNRILPNRTCLVTMFQSWSHRQEYVIKSLKLYQAMDIILVHCQSMKSKLIQLGADESQIRTLSYGIDHHFFSPQPETPQIPGMILSVGEVRSRDYDLLFRSVEGLPVSAKVLANGMWYAREKNTRVTASFPGNVEISRGVHAADLRHLYAQCQFVVLPVHNLVYSAGATASLEAMAMGRAVIVTGSPGIRDYVIDGENGIIVEPGNAQQLREAIEYLLANPAEARRLGENGRQFVEERANLEIYVAGMRSALLDALNQTSRN